jgi:hypothetical protein
LADNARLHEAGQATWRVSGAQAMPLVECPHVAVRFPCTLVRSSVQPRHALLPVPTCMPAAVAGEWPDAGASNAHVPALSSSE